MILQFTKILAYRPVALYTHIYITERYVIKIVHDDDIVLTPKLLSWVSLQLLAACLPSALFGIPVPAKCKVTEGTV